MEFQELSRINHLYPVVIVQSRYGGIYEGGAWFCIPQCTDIPEDAVGDDCDCVDFWMSDRAKQIGVGDTPDLALASMLNKNNIDYSGDEPLYASVLKEFRNPSKDNYPLRVSNFLLTDVYIERTDYFGRFSGFASDES